MRDRGPQGHRGLAPVKVKWHFAGATARARRLSLNPGPGWFQPYAAHRNESSSVSS